MNRSSGMKTKTHSTFRISQFALALALLSTLNTQVSTLFAQGTSFSYQGRLLDNGAPANGTYELRFTLFDDVSVGNQIGNAATNSGVVVSGGLFNATINFGSGAFPGANRWLQIGVRTNGSGGGFTS